ncbi:hypothetical protein FGB62_53g08 [Gracilaria domingensis]|nr:hypothetical protein FGB62_53g08 [Gracilaria domingensis]
MRRDGRAAEGLRKRHGFHGGKHEGRGHGDGIGADVDSEEMNEGKPWGSSSRFRAGVVVMAKAGNAVRADWVSYTTADECVSVECVPR